MAYVMKCCAMSGTLFYLKTIFFWVIEIYILSLIGISALLFGVYNFKRKFYDLYIHENLTLEIEAFLIFYLAI
jgi:hypothetical protein